MGKETLITERQIKALRTVRKFNTRGRPGASREQVKPVSGQTLKALQRRGAIDTRKPKRGQKGFGESFFYVTDFGRALLGS
jgi:hypothetical protein